MKSTQLKQKITPCKQQHSSLAKPSDNADTRYDYLMLLTNEWIASQDHSNDFIRSVN